MTADREERDARTWRLAGQIPQEAGPPATELLRPLTSAEFADLDEASELLNRLSANASYARVVDLLGAVETQHQALAERDRPAPPAALGPLGSAIEAFCGALAEIPSDLLRPATHDLKEAEAAELQAKIEKLEAEEEWRAALALSTIVRDRRANLVVNDRAVWLTDRARTQLKAESGLAPEAEPLIGLLRAGVEVGQRMTAHRLLAYEALIERHGLFVRRLGAEVPLGAPAAISSVPGEAEGSTNVSFKPFPLDRIVVLHIALRQSVSLLAEDGEDKVDDGVAEETGRGKPADQGRAPGDTEEPSEVAGETEDECDDEADLDAGRQPPEGPASDDAGDTTVEQGDTLPLDYAALVSFAERLPAEVERAWSQALDAVGLDEAHAGLAVRWHAVLTATGRLAQRDQEELQAAGLNARLPFLPNDPRALGVLDLDGDTDAQWAAASLGQMAGLQAVVESYRRLTNKGAGGANLASPDESSWWEAGAFAATRSRAFALRRLTAEAEAAQRARLGTSPAPQPGAWLTGAWVDRLRLADEAQLRGDWEAAVLHQWLALRERAAQLANIDRNAVAEEFEARLAENPELSQIGPGFLLLRAISHRILAGTPPPLGFSALVVTLLGDGLRRLCSGLSSHLAVAAAGEDPQKS